MRMLLCSRDTVIFFPVLLLSFNSKGTWLISNSKHVQYLNSKFGRANSKSARVLTNLDSSRASRIDKVYVRIYEGVITKFGPWVYPSNKFRLVEGQSKQVNET